jgi:hypothetical protein
MRGIAMLDRYETLRRMGWQAFLCLALFAAAGASMQSQNRATKPGEPIPEEPMKTFVIIFRQGPPAPTPEERQRTAADVVEWATRINSEGHKLDPRILAPEGTVRGEHGSTSLNANEGPVTALLFLQARDLEEATRIAESHPALRNRAVVEVRAWNPPVRPATEPSK